MDEKLEPSAIHSESLLNVPLLRHLFEDEHVRIVSRGVDAHWAYDDPAALRLDGFNPLGTSVFTSRKSALAEWLPHSHGSARPFNERDRLVREALFAVHDYLHIWAWQWIAELRPSLGVGQKPIDADNLDDLAFCHILTETVATFFDYWYLARVRLNEVADVGSAIRTLTIGYNEDHLGEYRRSQPKLDVQRPEYFVEKCTFYCDGIFFGFDILDLQRSALLDKWLTHELEYGEVQRAYARQWLADLAGLDIGRRSLIDPIVIDASWKHDLMHHFADLTWRKIHGEQLLQSPKPIELGKNWLHDRTKTADFRFTNFNTRGRSADVAFVPGLSFEYLFAQYRAQFDWDALEPARRTVFDRVLRAQDLALGDRLLSGERRIEPSPDEPDELFLMG